MLVNNLKQKEELNKIKEEEILLGAFFIPKTDGRGRCDILIIEDEERSYKMLNTNNFMIIPYKFVDKYRMALWLNQRDYKSCEAQITLVK